MLQRVLQARVIVNHEDIAKIGPGLLVFLGIGKSDDEETCRALASKVARLRIFDDKNGKMNLSLLDTDGSALVVSQFTLYADTNKGRRPSFNNACEPDRARQLYKRFVSELGGLGVSTKTGRFGARMQVGLVNNGPVTVLLEEPQKR